MDALNTHLAHYGAYHLDRRNVATHFVGIPLIVASIWLLLARTPAFTLLDAPLTAAHVATAVAMVFYLRLHLGLALAMGAFFAAMHVLALQFSGIELRSWQLGCVAVFVVGWVFQFVGHAWEGRKPAFFDDLRGLLVGPLFVLAEALFMLGWAPARHAEVMAKARALRQQATAG